MKNETMWDNFLKIRTSGRDDSCSNQYPYEPTPYDVLERLANSGYIRKRDTIVDYGCGKGRACFFLSYQIKANTIGVEYDERIYQCALRNEKTALKTSKVEFFHARAEEYILPDNVNHCFFFNPFSIELLKAVLVKIFDSYYAVQRQIYLYFYYPSDEYVSYLMQLDELEFEDEIDCSDIGDGEPMRERILIFRIAEILK